jgi:Fic family protein
MPTLQQKLERLTSLRPLAPAAVASLAAACDVEMVYASNSIEGNSLTLRETELVLSRGVTVAGKPLKDHVEAVNLSLAWQQVRELAAKGADLTEQDLLDLHRIVLTRVEDEHAGRYRSAAVRIAGAKLVPPNPLKVPELMGELFASLTNIPEPLIRAATLHHGIARIHPFGDGNGRVARLAMNFILLAAGYPPVSVAPEDRAAYYAALEAADQGNFPAFLEFLTNQLDRTLDLWLEALEPQPS